MVGKINSKRVVFLKRKQRNFINKILSKISIGEAAGFCNLSERTIRDWRRERFLMDYRALKILCNKTHFLLPRNVKLKDRYWYVEKGASKGGRALFKKYGKIGGDPEYRKKKWYEWWEKEGKYKSHTILNLPKPIKKPVFSKDLAEFVGIMLGDGGITKYQVVITLHSEDEKEYGKFVISLIKKLFNVPVGVHYDKNSASVDLTVSRIKLVHFCTEKAGLKVGNKIKQKVDIPNWIQKNKQYSIACIRGLIDTDGCVFTHRYKVNRKIYNYKKLAFTSCSEPLRRSVFNIIKENGLNPRFAQRKDVRLDSIEDMRKYFHIFSSHNPKVLKQYLK